MYNKSKTELYKFEQPSLNYIQNLIELSLKSLKKFYIPVEFMFARSGRYDPTSNTLELDAPSIRNTAIALIALNRLKNLNYNIDFDTDKILRKLVRQHMNKVDYEDVGLILWADSWGKREYLDSIWSELFQRCSIFINKKGDANFNTMRMSWLLTALCYYYPIARDRQDVKQLAENVKERIVKNFNLKSNLFYNSNRIRRKNIIVANYHHKLATLSSQTFTIMALSLYGQTFNDVHVLQIAARCADKLCELQGNQGQWWWRYNVNRGIVAEKYPVYSVNQDGTVPMAFFILQSTLSTNKYEKNIFKGLEWVYGNNELNDPLIVWQKDIIWRGISRNEFKKPSAFLDCLNGIASVYFGGNNLERIIYKKNNFYIIKEMYSYHPSRLILAFCYLLS